MGLVVHVKAFGLDPEGNEEPMKGLEPGDNRPRAESRLKRQNYIVWKSKPGEHQSGKARREPRRRHRSETHPPAC